MAEEKKQSRGDRMYGKSPKIAPVEEKENPAEGPAREASEEAGGGGTEAIPLSEVHVRESKAMHTRHQQEYSAMLRRHAAEIGGGGAPAKSSPSGESSYKEKSVGKSGTEPKAA